MSVDCIHRECAKRYECQYPGAHSTPRGYVDIFIMLSKWFWLLDGTELHGPFASASEAYFDATREARLI